MKLTSICCFLFIVGFAFAQRPAQGPISTKRFNPEKKGYKLVWEDQF